jgi:hypothetical protein
MKLLYVVLLFHLLICIYYGVRVVRKPSGLPWQFLAVIFSVPVFGFFSALIVEYLSVHQKGRTKPLPLEDFCEKNTNLNPIPILDHDDVSTLVPLEEALVLNDPRIFRSLMMEVVKNPSCYTDLLKAARLKQDPEITHYASAAIMEMQRAFELEMQSCRAACFKNPDNESILDQYIGVVQRYIKSGFIEGILLENQREKLDQLLDKKIRLRPEDKQSHYIKLENCTEWGRFRTAWEAAYRLQDKWPTDQEVWLLTIRLCVNSHDQLNLWKTIRRMESEPICWTMEGFSQFEFFRDAFLKIEANTFPAVSHRLLSPVRAEKRLVAGSDAYRR